MKEIAAIIASALFLGGVAAVLAVQRYAEKHQPIAYNHKKHIDSGLECATCHTGIADGTARAQIPGIDVCMGCHESDDNPKTKPVRDFAARKEAIPWQRVYRVPDHVYFSHARHVGAGKLDCALCHGDMPHKETPVTSELVPISMARCIACHKKRGASTDCLACHR